jgi:hypothetical protein
MVHIESWIIAETSDNEDVIENKSYVIDLAGYPITLLDIQELDDEEFNTLIISYDLCHGRDAEDESEGASV